VSEAEKVDYLLDLCFDRNYNVPRDIRLYLHNRLKHLQDVCKE